MSFQFEMFEPIPKKVPVVTMNTSGRIHFNPAAAEIWLAGLSFVQIGYDKYNKAIGLLPVTEESPHTVKISRISTGANLAVRGFARLHEIKPDKVVKLTPIKEDKYIVLQLASNG